MLVSIMSVVAVFKSVAQKSFDHIIGRWLSDDKTIEVEIYKSGNEYNPHSRTKELGRLGGASDYDERMHEPGLKTSDAGRLCGQVCWLENGKRDRFGAAV